MLTFIKAWIGQFIRDEEGASAIEYGMIVGIIALVVILAITQTGLGETLGGFFTDISEELNGGA